MLIVSHDRDFLDRTVTITLGLDGSGKVDIVAGGYEDWESKRDGARAAPRRRPRASPASSRAPAPPKHAQTQAHLQGPARLRAAAGADRGAGRGDRARRGGACPTTTSTARDPRLFEALTDADRRRQGGARRGRASLAGARRSGRGARHRLDGAARFGAAGAPGSGRRIVDEALDCSRAALAAAARVLGAAPAPGPGRRAGAADPLSEPHARQRPARLCDPRSRQLQRLGPGLVRRRLEGRSARPLGLRPSVRAYDVQVDPQPGARAVRPADRGCRRLQQRLDQRRLHQLLRGRPRQPSRSACSGPRRSGWARWWSSRASSTPSATW